MGPSLSAVLFALVAQAFAFGIVKSAHMSAGRGFVIWAAAAPLIFFVPNPLSVILVLGALMLFLAPAAASQRVALFIVVAPSVPLFIEAYIPFPGINFLAALNNYRLAVIVLLLPVLFYRHADEHARQSWTLSDFCLLAYAAYTAAMVAGAINTTSGLRFFVEQLIVLIAPYLVVVRALKSPEDLEICLRAFLACSIILAMVAMMATLKQWDFYRLTEPLTVLAAPDFRSGWLRVTATATTHSLGFHFAAALLVLERLKSSLKLGALRLTLLRALLFSSLIVTGSRGALAALAVSIGVYLICTTARPAVRRTYFALFGLAGVAATIWLLSGDYAKVDPYGTFAYRQLLLSTSLQYIQDHLFFGDLSFTSSGKFDQLLQGQGIIDITNLYLQIALNFGLIGFALIFLVFAQSIRGLVIGARREAIRKEAGTCAVLLAILIGWLALVATTSDAGLTMYLGILFAALGRAAYTIATRDQTVTAAPTLSLTRVAVAAPKS